MFSKVFVCAPGGMMLLPVFSRVPSGRGMMSLAVWSMCLPGGGGGGGGGAFRGGLHSWEGGGLPSDGRGFAFEGGLPGGGFAWSGVCI